ncbi:MAG: choice-of-anchor J domain-containing protein [Bacteroidia bacterium]|nr:choice-of-anchor J domain-containing protein [Bacteroidia bacterium]
MKMIFNKWNALFLMISMFGSVSGQIQSRSAQITKPDNTPAGIYKSLNQVLYSNDFQSSDPLGGMINENVDANPDNAYILQNGFNFSSGWVPILLQGSTNVLAASNSYFASPAQADRWLITPAITITDTSLLSFDAISVDVQGLGIGDSYEVYATTTIAGSFPTHNDFSGVPLISVTSESDTWTKHTIDLRTAGYQSGKIYIAFRHTSFNIGVLGLDSINVSATVVVNMGGDFENVPDFSLDLSPWTNIDGDSLHSYGFLDNYFTHMGEAFGFIAFNPAACSPAITGMDPHAGLRYGASFAVMDTANSGLANDDWIISPLGTVADSGKVTFWARSYTASFGNKERFKVGISTTTPTEAAMTIISPGNFVEADTVWTKYQYDLSAYTGQQIYIGINCVSIGYKSFIFMLDDILIDFTPVDVSEVEKNKVTIYPNPAYNILNINGVINSSIFVYNMTGSVVEYIKDAPANNSLDISGFATGTYLVRVLGNNNIFTRLISIIR